MPLNIKNAEVEMLINEVVALTGESKTEAVRKALLERKGKLSLQVSVHSEERLLRFLEQEVWPHIPENLLGKGVSQEDQDDLLDFGPEGV